MEEDSYAYYKGKTQNRRKMTLYHYSLLSKWSYKLEKSGIFFPVLTIDGEIFRVDGWGFLRGNLVQELKCSNEALNCFQFYKLLQKY